MRRWALFVAILYFAILVVLTAPVLMLAFSQEGEAGPEPGAIHVSLEDIVEVYSYPWYWFGLAVMAVSQFALLMVPVRIESRRPLTRGALWPTVVAAALMTAALFFGAASSIVEFLLRDKAIDDFNGALILCGLGGLLLWILWSVVFYRIGRTSVPDDLVSRQCRLMFKGSILELLIAVPTHIVARYRNYCCASLMTFIGLTMGIAVMLFSFGPSVFFLYADRWKRRHPQRFTQM